MSVLTRICVVAAFALSAIAPAFAGEHGTEEEALALVKKAVAFDKANGRDKLIAEVNNPNGQFKLKDLYLFIGSVKPDGLTLAHGANPKLVGKALKEMTDVDGVHFVRKFREAANSKEGQGWVDYKFPNPVTKLVEPKRTFIFRIDENYIACGVYK